MRYARRMNGYSEVPHNGEINNYLRKDLDAKATAKNDNARDFAQIG